MERAARYIVVSVKRENLRFIGIAAVIRTMNYFIDIADICSSYNVGLISFRIAADNAAVICGIGVLYSLFAVGQDSFGELG